MAQQEVDCRLEDKPELQLPLIGHEHCFHFSQLPTRLSWSHRCVVDSTPQDIVATSLGENGTFGSTLMITISTGGCWILCRHLSWQHTLVTYYLSVAVFHPYLARPLLGTCFLPPIVISACTY